MARFSEVVALKYVAMVGPLPEYVKLSPLSFDVDVPNFVWTTTQYPGDEYASKWNRWSAEFVKAYEAIHGGKNPAAAYDEMIVYALWCMQRRT